MKRTKYKILSDQDESSNSADEATCSLLPEEERDDTQKLTLRREVGLLSGITLLLGSIIGTGIFITPGNVLRQAKWVSLDLVLWAAAGLNAIMDDAGIRITTAGGLCEAELGALLPASGGDYAFFLAAGKPYGTFGDLPAFLYSWTLFIVDPASSSVQGLTFTAYVLSLPYPDCKPPYMVTVLVTALYITIERCKLLLGGGIYKGSGSLLRNKVWPSHCNNCDWSCTFIQRKPSAGPMAIC